MSKEEPSPHPSLALLTHQTTGSWRRGLTPTSQGRVAGEGGGGRGGVRANLLPWGPPHLKPYQFLFQRTRPQVERRHHDPSLRHFYLALKEEKQLPIVPNSPLRKRTSLQAELAYALR